MITEDGLPNGMGTQRWLPMRLATAAHLVADPASSSSESSPSTSAARRSESPSRTNYNGTQRYTHDKEMSLDVVQFSGSDDNWEPETPPLPPASPPVTSVRPSSWTAHARKKRRVTRRDAAIDLRSPSPPQVQILDESEDELASSPLPQPADEDVMPPLDIPPALTLASQSPPSIVPTPPPSPPRKSVFDIQDDDEMQAMYAQLSTIMAGRESSPARGPAAGDDNDKEGSNFGEVAGHASDMSDEDYEAKRARKLRENQALLAQLGLGVQQAAEELDKGRKRSATGISRESDDKECFSDDDAIPTQSKPKRGRRGRPAKNRGRKSDANAAAADSTQRIGRSKKAVPKIKLAEDGTTTSLPLPGTTHELAYIDVPPLNERRRDDWIYIADFLIKAPTPPPPPTPSPSPSPPPEKKRRLALAEERKSAIEARKADREARRAAKETARSEKKQRREEADAARAERRKAAALQKQKKIKPSRPMTGDETTCHQCRRKSNEAKMHCSNSGLALDGTTRHCTLLFCKPCMDIRYGADQPDVIEDAWDPPSKHWHCPRCRGVCNCSICLQKAGLERFIPSGGNARNSSLSLTIRGKDGERLYKSVRHYLESQGVTRDIKAGLPGVVANDDEEGLLMARINQLKNRLATKRGEVAVISTSRPRRDEDDDEGDDDSHGEDEEPSGEVPEAWQRVKKISLRIPKTRLPSSPPSSTSSPAVSFGQQSARMQARCKKVSATNPPSSIPAANSASSSTSSKPLNSTVESQVWVRGIADLTDSDSDLTEDDDDELEQVEDELGSMPTLVQTAAGADASYTRNASEDSTLTSLSDWSRNSSRRSPSKQTPSMSSAYLSAFAAAAVDTHSQPMPSKRDVLMPDEASVPHSDLAAVAEMPRWSFDPSAAPDCRAPSQGPPAMLDQTMYGAGGSHQSPWKEPPPPQPQPPQPPQQHLEDAALQQTGDLNTAINGDGNDVHHRHQEDESAFFSFSSA